MRRKEPWPAAEDCAALVDGEPTPGTCVPPPGVRPGWDWTPPGGLYVRPGALPWWVRLWSAVPVADRWAHVWMWHHGASSFPPPRLPDGSDSAGVREPRRPAPGPSSLSADRAPAASRTPPV